MRALSVAQPWAECIVSKGKNIENRSWNTKHRGYFLIHASASKSKERFQYCFDDYGIKFDPEELSFGAIVGIAELSDVVTKKTLTRTTKKWFYGEYGFVLSNVIKLKQPIKVKGSLSFWKTPADVLKDIQKQLSQQDIKKINQKILGIKNA